MDKVVNTSSDETKDYETPTWSSFENLGSGIFVYRDVLPKELEIIKRLEDNLNEDHPRYKWMEAFVGYFQSMPEYRDCQDFKFKKSDIALDTSEQSLNLQALWQDCYDRQKPAVNHYQKMFNLGELRYWEAMNFVKYNRGQHFQYHHDHGFSYNCTVSLVAYPNDDYEGGELSFQHQGLTISPKAGDLYIFPSTYMYSHRAMPVHSGTKYSVVTMLDYSAKFHTPEMYRETGD
jgi:Rps23 Pro-64 3,4-dihydroxylase Tpa1-like proline 4-hydroxylase